MYEYRAGTNPDLVEKAAHLLCLLHAEDNARLPAGERRAFLARPQAIELLEDAVRNDEMHFVVGYSKGEAIGYSDGIPGLGNYEIGVVYVMPEHRFHGIGHELVRGQLNHADSLKYCFAQMCLARGQSPVRSVLASFRPHFSASDNAVRAVLDINKVRPRKT
jgi:GNAT superfamily N-acetyltransferase